MIQIKNCNCELVISCLGSKDTLLYLKQLEDGIYTVEGENTLRTYAIYGGKIKTLSKLTDSQIEEELKWIEQR